VQRSAIWAAAVFVLLHEDAVSVLTANLSEAAHRTLEPLVEEALD